tara:strand:+ start:164 stop:388 length:225 start_codon:yes stop_codon:yes gene_type:complete
MNKIFTEGSFVYVPSSSRLYQMDEVGNSVTSAKILNEPVYVLYLGESGAEYSEVFYEGKVWKTSKENVFLGKEK